MLYSPSFGMVLSVAEYLDTVVISSAVTLCSYIISNFGYLAGCMATASRAVGFPSVSTALTFIVCPTVADVRTREISVPPEP